jgi:hypothetical protein
MKQGRLMSLEALHALDCWPTYLRLKQARRYNCLCNTSSLASKSCGIAMCLQGTHCFSYMIFLYCKSFARMESNQQQCWPQVKVPLATPYRGFMRKKIPCAAHIRDIVTEFVFILTTPAMGHSGVASQLA